MERDEGFPEHTEPVLAVMSEENRICGGCGRKIGRAEFLSKLGLCGSCGKWNRLYAPERIFLTADDDTFRETDGGMRSENILRFPGYDEKLEECMKKSGLNEAVVTGICRIAGMETAIAVMDTRFLMGSMGSVVGDKIIRLAERARKMRLPLVIFSASGGARMQEGVFSLVQMARCSVAVRRHSDAGLFFVSVLTDPTTGGVCASFAMQGDVVIAEKGATVGFAGPRVMEQFVRQEIPEDYQTAEYQLSHGFVDAVVERDRLRSMLGWLLKFHGKEQKLAF
jgi:acetyl-CoA carboxylase carboxyl transferase subunit beta